MSDDRAPATTDEEADRAVARRFCRFDDHLVYRDGEPRGEASPGRGIAPDGKAVDRRRFPGANEMDYTRSHGGVRSSDNERIVYSGFSDESPASGRFDNHTAPTSAAFAPATSDSSEFPT